MFINKRYNIIDTRSGEDVAYLELHDEVEKLIRDRWAEAVYFYIVDLNNVEPAVPAMVWLNIMARLMEKPKE